MRDLLDATMQWGAGFFKALPSEQRGVLNLCYAEYAFLGDAEKTRHKFCVQSEAMSLCDYLMKKNFLNQGYTNVVLHHFDFSKLDLFVQALTFLDNKYFQLSQAQLTFYQVCQLLDHGFYLQNSTYWIKDAVHFREYIMAYHRYAVPLSGIARQKSFHSVKVDFSNANEFGDNFYFSADDFFVCCTPVNLQGVHMKQVHADKLRERFGEEADAMLRGVIILPENQENLPSLPRLTF